MLKEFLFYWQISRIPIKSKDELLPLLSCQFEFSDLKQNNGISAAKPILLYCKAFLWIFKIYLLQLMFIISNILKKAFEPTYIAIQYNTIDFIAKLCCLFKIEKFKMAVEKGI